MAKKTARKFYRLPEFSEAVKAGILPAYVNTWGPAHRAVIEQMYNQACFADNVGKVVVRLASLRWLTGSQGFPALKS